MIQDWGHKNQDPNTGTLNIEILGPQKTDWQNSQSRDIPFPLITWN